MDWKRKREACLLKRSWIQVLHPADEIDQKDFRKEYLPGLFPEETYQYRPVLTLWIPARWQRSQFSGLEEPSRASGPGGDDA